MPDKVFISHTHEDNALCSLLERALVNWDGDFWVDRSGAQPGAVLTDEIHRNMRECNTFARLCTEAASHSRWVHRELGMFLAFQMEPPAQPDVAPCKLISVYFDGYDPDGLEQAYLYIDAKGKPDAAWLDDIRRALRKPMGAVVFDHDDASYLWWVHKYSQGFVINAYRRPTPVYNTIKNPQWQLHRATCHRISGPRPASDSNLHTGSKYVKVCSLDRSVLQEYAQHCTSPVAPFVANCSCLQ